MALAEEDAPPNKSAKKPSKPLDTIPSNEIVMDGKKAQENVTSQLKLKNSSKKKVAYKIMCNHPFMVTVDKEIGFIEPGHTVTIVVTRVKFDADKYDEQGRRTCILLQHVNVSPKADSAKKIWANVIGAVAMKKRMAIKLIGDGDRILGEGTDESAADDE